MKQEDVFKDYDITISRMGRKGVLLVTGEGNPMTIGWGQLGVMWRRPVFTVMVRRSRFSYGAISQDGQFSVNIMPPELDRVLGICGSKSGRDTDKIGLCGLTLEDGETISVPRIGEAEIIYECKTLYKEDMVPRALPDDLESACYPDGDYHTFFMAEVLNVLNRR